MSDEIVYIIGQGVGIIAVTLGFISFLMKTPKGIITFQMLSSFVFAVHFYMIGVKTAMALTIISGISAILYYFRNKRGSKGLFEPILCVSSIVIASILTWTGPETLLVMFGLIAATISLSLSDPQKIRYVMFIKVPLCFTYNLMALSIGGIISDSSSLVSLVIGVIRDRKKQKNEIPVMEEK